MENILTALINHILNVAQRHWVDGGNPVRYNTVMFYDVASTVAHFNMIHYGGRGYINDKIMLPERL